MCPGQSSFVKSYGVKLALALSLACVFLWAGCAKPRAQSLPLASASLTLATWNVNNLFDTVDGPLEDKVLSPEQYATKLDSLAKVINAIDVDFLALEEVENVDCLLALNERLARPYPLLGLIEGNDPRGIDVAFLSRPPVRRVESHRAEELPQEKGVSERYLFSRDCLEVELETNPPLLLFINHFKSQLGSKKASAAKRRSQARGVVAIASRARNNENQPLKIVLGDLNDRPGSWSLQPLGRDFEDILSSWPEPMRASHRSKHGRSSLDYIFIDKTASARVLKPKVWQQTGAETSDHDPVSAKILLDAPWPKKTKSYVWTH